MPMCTNGKHLSRQLDHSMKPKKSKSRRLIAKKVMTKDYKAFTEKHPPGVLTERKLNQKN